MDPTMGGMWWPTPPREIIVYPGTKIVGVSCLQRSHDLVIDMHPLFCHYGTRIYSTTVQKICRPPHGIIKNIICSYSAGIPMLYELLVLKLFHIVTRTTDRPRVTHPCCNRSPLQPMVAHARVHGHGRRIARSRHHAHADAAVGLCTVVRAQRPHQHRRVGGQGGTTQVDPRLCRGLQGEGGDRFTTFQAKR